MSHRSSSTAGRQIRVQLQGVLSGLREVQSAIAVAVAALSAQNADLDADVARLLRRTVGDKLEDQIERLDAVLRQLGPAELRRKPARRKK